MKIVKSPYLSEKLSNFDEIRYTTANVEPDCSHVTKKLQILLAELKQQKLKRLILLRSTLTLWQCAAKVISAFLIFAADTYLPADANAITEKFVRGSISVTRLSPTQPAGPTHDNSVASAATTYRLIFATGSQCLVDRCTVYTGLRGCCVMPVVCSCSYRVLSQHVRSSVFYFARPMA